jgi:5-methylcytosine-specific restriction endonuclease McrA
MSDDEDYWWRTQGENLLFEELWRDEPEWKRRRREYLEYLRSEVWRGKRNAALEAFGRICSRCRATGSGLHVHHRTYRRFGGREVLSDLEVLCKSCHAQKHDCRSRYLTALREHRNYED